MPIDIEVPIAQSVANGLTTVFPHAFTLFAADDLVVKVDTAGVITYPVFGSDYTVTGLGSNSGSVVFSVAPVATAVVTRYRDTKLKRTTDYQENGDLLANTLDADIDRLWMALQERVAGGTIAPTSMRVPVGETISELPKASDRALRVLAFDSLGAPLLIAGVDSGSAAALALDVASAASASKGAGQIGFNSALTYGANTVGKSLKDAQTPAYSSITGKPTNLTGLGISSSDPLLVPAGSVLDFAGETPPTGWLECDGSSLLRASYPALFSAIGTLHGAADDLHFNLPDMRGVFPRGWSHGTTANDPDVASRVAAATGGATGDHVGSKQSAYAGNNTFVTWSDDGDGSTGTNRSVQGMTVNGVTVANIGQGSGTVDTNPGNTRPVNIAVMFIIKY